MHECLMDTRTDSGFPEVANINTSELETRLVSKQVLQLYLI